MEAGSLLVGGDGEGPLSGGGFAEVNPPPVGGFDLVPQLAGSVLADRVGVGGSVGVVVQAGPGSGPGVEKPQHGFLDHLLTGLRGLSSIGFDLLYLGRCPLEPDQPVRPGVVAPGYSHCSFAYLLARRALYVLLGAGLEQALVPIDEFLPALYLDHPRPDLRARFPRRLTALAFDPPLARQRPKTDAGSDTEDSTFTGS